MMTLAEVMTIADVNAQLRAFRKLPKDEQDKLHTPEERAAMEANDELQGRYARIGKETGEHLTSMLKNRVAEAAVIAMLRLQAVTELQNSPQFGRSSIDTMKQQIRNEVMTS